MSQPTPYSPTTDFNAYQLANPSAPYNGALIDVEFDAIELTLSETLANLALIQRDDGGLKNQVVTPDSLNMATINMIGEWNPRGNWATGVNYAVLDMVTVSTVTYVNNTAHTSGATFNDDLALGYWQPVNGTGLIPGSLSPSSIAFSATDRILGRATAGAGAGEEIVCTSAARSILDDASIAAICTTLGLGTGNNVTFNSVTTGAVQVTGLTASSMIYLNATQQITSTLAPTNGQLLIGSTGAVPVLGALTGTANRVTVTNGAGTITLSAPQDIATSSTPTFATVNLTNLTQGQVPFAGSSSALTGSTQLVWDNTNFRLGIRASSPGYQLDVQHPTAPPTVNIEGASVGAASTRNAKLRLTATAVIGSGFVLGANNSTFGSSEMYAVDSTETNLFYGAGIAGLQVGSGASYSFSASANALGADTFIVRDAANTVALRNAANAQALRVYNTFTDTSNYQRAAIQTAAGYVELAAETAGTGADDINVRLSCAGLGFGIVQYANGVACNIRRASTSLTASAGASVTATNLIPDGAFVLGVVTRITTTLGVTSGTTGYQVGDGTDADRWGNITGTAAGTTSDNTNATANFTGAFTAANNVVLTANGGNFDGTGVIRVVVVYIDLTAPTA